MKSDSYKTVFDTSYQFGYNPITFDGKYWGNVSKYECSLNFRDTTDKTVFVFQKLAPGYTEWTEEGHIDFSAIQLLTDTGSCFLPIDLDTKGNALIWHTHDTVQCRFNAWLINSVNQHPVIPFLIIKNVKKH